MENDYATFEEKIDSEEKGPLSLSEVTSKILKKKYLNIMGHGLIFHFQEYLLERLKSEKFLGNIGG